MSNVRQLLDNGVPIYPITDKSLVLGLNDVPFEDRVIAWDGASTPTPANIPAGVTVTYDGNTYTGTLAASASTVEPLYLVASTSQPGEYDRYITTHTGSTYAWVALGSTAPVSPVIADNLTTNDASKALSAKQGKILGDEVGELEAKVTELDLDVNGGTYTERVDVSSNYPNQYFNGNPAVVGNTYDQNPGDLQGTMAFKLSVVAGDKFIIFGLGNTGAVPLCVLTDSSKVVTQIVRENARSNGVTLNIQENGTLYINLYSYDASTDSVTKEVTITEEGLVSRVSELETETASLENAEKNKKILFLPDSDFTKELTGVVDYYATEDVDTTKEYYLKICGYRENNKHGTFVQVYDGNGTMVDQEGWDASVDKVYKISCAGFIFLIDSATLPVNSSSSFISYNYHLNKFAQQSVLDETARAKNAEEELDKRIYNKKLLFLEDSDFSKELTGIVDYYATEEVDVTKEYYLKICGYRQNIKQSSFIQVYDGNGEMVEQTGWDASVDKVYELSCAGFIFLVDSAKLPENSGSAFVTYNYHLNKFPRKVAVGDGSSKLMKVVIESTGAFRIRTKYNAEKDIIITHYINGNSCLSFQYAYIGAKTLSDAEIMVSANRVSNNSDSTAPLYYTPEFWFVFGQHGYLIPTISNSVGMTSADVGAIWKDQNNNRFTVGKVTEEKIYLLPYIYQDASGHYHREYTGSITTLTHISGGSYTTEISVSGFETTQIYRLMSHENRKFYADGVEVNVGKTVFCDNFTAQEEQIGYDPATISDWFGGADGKADLTNAEVMVRLLFSFNYHGPMCCLNTTFDLRREILFGAYGALQQEFPSDNGEYLSMVMIPKVAPRDGIEMDKPFHSISGSPEIEFNRTAQHLKDVNNLPDRMVCYLYNPNSGDYLVGMAAGFSLVSGDTPNAKRLENIPIGDANYHYLSTKLGRNYVNKFYNMAFNTAPYASNEYYLPTTYFKQVNAYVCYFDPAENVGQVYWYKDGNRYLIYAHCQQVRNKLRINIPEEMNGLSLSVVEKTTNTELLTDVIQNGKILVNFNSADANYIVLCAE